MNIFYKIVNIFIDKQKIIHYNKAMKFLEKTLKSTFKITGIINLHFFEFPKDFYTETDKHPFFEIVYVSSGKLYIKSDKYSGLLKKGEIIIHYPNEEHSLSCEENSAPTVIIIGFNCVCKELESFALSPKKLSTQEIKSLAEVIKEGRNVFAPPYDVPTYDMKKKTNIIYGSEQMLQNVLECFLLELLRKKNSKKDNYSNNTNNSLKINEISNYLSENITEKITIDELAFLFNTNRSTLCKEFKKSVGKTINEYIKDKKIKKAEFLLKNTSKSITIIAEELGFESIHYFTKFFKKNTGKSPKYFKKL